MRCLQKKTEDFLINSHKGSTVNNLRIVWSEMLGLLVQWTSLKGWLGWFWPEMSQMLWECLQLRSSTAWLCCPVSLCRSLSPPSKVCDFSLEIFTEVPRVFRILLAYTMVLLGAWPERKPTFLAWSCWQGFDFGAFKNDLVGLLFLLHDVNWIHLFHTYCGIIQYQEERFYITIFYRCLIIICTVMQDV